MLNGSRESYEALRQLHVASLMARFPAMVEQLGWDPEQLSAERERRLRALVAHAKARSAFHRERLAEFDLSSIIEADLSRIPTMSKADLVERFEDIVTDGRVTRAAAEAHIETLDEGDAYLFDAYHVVATGGSSGRRAVIVWDWDGWAECFLSLSRRAIVQPSRSERARIIASVSGDHASHMSSSIMETFSSPLVTMHRVPASLPIDEIVRRLNGIRPTALQGYPSMIHRLALEALDGRLKIEPEGIVCGSETLEPATRTLLEETWGAPVQNGYGVSEFGGVATDCGQGDGWMHLNDDVLIVEVEDERVIVTNLMNKVMPVIRYEVDDQVTLLDTPCPCGSAHRVVGDIRGRASETFEFTSGTVHPLVFSSSIGTDRHVADYQVRQSGDSVSVAVVPQGRVDLDRLRSAVEKALRDSGVGHVAVSIELSTGIARTDGTAKVRRFIPDRRGGHLHSK